MHGWVWGVWGVCGWYRDCLATSPQAPATFQARLKKSGSTCTPMVLSPMVLYHPQKSLPHLLNLVLEPPESACAEDLGQAGSGGECFVAKTRERVQRPMKNQLLMVEIQQVGST